MEITTPEKLTPGIEKALSNLMPTQAPALSDDDLNYLADVTP